MCRADRLAALSPIRDAAVLPSLDGGGVRVEALGLMGHVMVQLPNGGTPEHLRSLIDLPLPERPNRAAGVEPLTMWLGPRAWVAVTLQANDAAPLAARIATALRGVGGHAVDLTDAHQSLRVSGRDAPALLAQGCPLDLEGSTFSVGDATRTVVARMPAIVHRAGADQYLVHVDRSLACQLWDWLARGVAEIAALARLEQAVAVTPTRPRMEISKVPQS